MIQFRRDRPSPAMQAGTSQDLPICTSSSIMVGSSLLLSTLRAPSIRTQVRNGRMATSTIINNNNMKKSRVTIREDVCPLPMVTTMTNPWAIMSRRWSAPASTPSRWLLKRRSKTFETSYTNTPSGKQKWESASPASSSTRSRRTRIGTTCSRVTTLTHHFDRPQQQPTWGGAPIYLR
jgi:hypothetical protein